MASGENKEGALSADELKQLDLLLFGSDADPLDVARWRGQGFTFSKTVPFGLTQLYGGPCGILAPVQAFILKSLLFDSNRTDPIPITSLAPTPDQANQHLVSALSTILLLARQKDIILVLGDSLSNLKRVVCPSADATRAMLARNLPILQSPIGVLLFVYSVILTRGIAGVRQDMDLIQDREMCLVGRFGHCSQDLLNLMLTGRAVTNVFDGSKSLGGVTLRGISRQGDVGFLSLLESLRYTKVGENYKSPRLPIWVIGSATHYTVLFGLSRAIGQVSEEEKVLKNAKAAFVELDAEEVGFIPVASVAQVLARLDIRPASMDQVSSVVDPDNLGLCLWPNFAKFITTWLKEHADWNCTACTYLNGSARNVCEICNSPKPAVVAQPAAKKPLSTFDLCHFNGLEGHGKAVATLSAMSVTFVDEDGLQQGDKSAKQGCREVIRTRWPTAEVRVHGGVEPKIT